MKATQLTTTHSIHHTLHTPHTLYTTHSIHHTPYTTLHTPSTIHHQQRGTTIILRDTLCDTISTTAGTADEEDSSNSSCGTCGDGGTLLCCTGCTLAFHLKCLEPPLASAPPDDVDWFCILCAAERCVHMHRACVHHASCITRVSYASCITRVCVCIIYVGLYACTVCIRMSLLLVGLLFRSPFSSCPLFPRLHMVFSPPSSPSSVHLFCGSPPMADACRAADHMPVAQG
jgi:hypothetical protein